MAFVPLMLCICVGIERVFGGVWGMWGDSKGLNVNEGPGVGV